MKIESAKKLYAERMDALWVWQRTLTACLKSGEKSGVALPDVDRVEISRELSEVEAQYNEVKEALERIRAAEAAQHNAEVLRQQSRAAAKAADDLGKVLEIYRRIASGGQVPPEDERKLMEFSHELYMAAKNAALMQEGDGEKYDSLWKDEENATAETDHSGLSGAEMAVPAASLVEETSTHRQPAE